MNGPPSVHYYPLPDGAIGLDVRDVVALLYRVTAHPDPGQCARVYADYLAGWVPAVAVPDDLSALTGPTEGEQK